MIPCYRRAARQSPATDTVGSGSTRRPTTLFSRQSPFGDPSAAAALQKAAKDKKGHVRDAVRIAIQRLENAATDAAPEWQLEFLCPPTTDIFTSCRWYVRGDVFTSPDTLCRLSSYHVSVKTEDNRIIFVRERAGAFFIRGVKYALVDHQGRAKKGLKDLNLDEIAKYCRL